MTTTKNIVDCGESVYDLKIDIFKPEMTLYQFIFPE